MLTGCFPLPFSSAACEKIAFKDKRKVEFSIYGGTILHNMLHAKKNYMTEWNRKDKIVLCLKPEVKLYGT